MSVTEERFVPWLNRSEFFGVYKGLYSQNASERRRALDKVAVWRCRAFNKLPVAVDSTASLVESLLKKDLNKNACSKVHQYENKLSLAVSLIRFVNHIIEQGQTKQFAQSVHVLAEEIGLPEWLIDIRHNSTHGSLPSLSLLEEGALWSLHWLKSEYWEKQTTVEESTILLREEDEDPELRQYISNLLVDFSQIQFELLNNSVTSSDTSVNCILTEMENIFQKSNKTVARILVKEGYLILSREQLDAFGVDYNSFMEPNLNLPNLVLQFWKPVLICMHDLGATPLLLDLLRQNLTANDSLKNRFCASWIFEIIRANQRVKENRKVSSKNLFHTYCDLPVEQILRQCLRQPGGFSLLLVETLVENQLFSGDMNKAVSLMQIFTGSKTYTEYDKVENSLSHTLKDLLNEIHSVKQKSLRGSKEVNFKPLIAENRIIPWQLCTVMNRWKTCPIGSLLGQDVKTLRLESSLVPNTLPLDLVSETTDEENSLDWHMPDVQTDIGCFSHGIITDNCSVPQSYCEPFVPVINLL